MNVLLVGTDSRLCEEWEREFRGVAGVRVQHARFELLSGEYDCLVSPANSFGLMDGGMDAAIIDYFGVSLEEKVQQEIWRVYRGEQPVGTCLMVPTGDARCAWLAHCPTMREPMNVAGTNHAYAAFLAALTSAEAAGVEILACPGLGTGVGQMPAEVAARQMRYAYDCWRAPYRPSKWEMLSDREWRSHGRTRDEFLRHKFLKNG